ncbi:MAG: N-acetyltransferase [Myxococcales bacterium]|nr:MAG: N-acetyltransferase [Myxococcales bacterium]
MDPDHDDAPSLAETTLRSERLVLEPLTVDHADALFAGMSDPALYGFIPQEPPASPDALRLRYTRLAARGSADGRERWLNWAVRHGDAYVGLVEVTMTSEHASLAYFVFTPWQRRGLAREACAAALAEIWRRDPVPCAVATVDDRNAASLALLASLGFVEERRVPGADFFKGHPSDEIVLRLARPRDL